MTMITPSYLGETIEYSSLHACRSTLEDPTCPIMGCADDAKMTRGQLAHHLKSNHVESAKELQPELLVNFGLQRCGQCTRLFAKNGMKAHMRTCNRPDSPILAAAPANAAPPVLVAQAAQQVAAAAQGVECAICTDVALPNNPLCPLECKQKHSFHASCIAEWFEQQSTCPTCGEQIRLFNGVAVQERKQPVSQAYAEMMSAQAVAALHREVVIEAQQAERMVELSPFTILQPGA